MAFRRCETCPWDALNFECNGEDVRKGAGSKESNELVEVVVDVQNLRKPVLEVEVLRGPLVIGCEVL